MTSNIALAIAPVCGQKKVVCLSPSASSPKLSGVSPYFFRNYPSDTLEGHVMAEYAVRKMKIRSVTILYVDNEYGQGLDSVFKQRFQVASGHHRHGEGLSERDHRFCRDDQGAQVVAVGCHLSARLF